MPVVPCAFFKKMGVFEHDRLIQLHEKQLFVIIFGYIPDGSFLGVSPLNG
jgi:hypothetical protein